MSEIVHLVRPSPLADIERWCPDRSAASTVYAVTAANCLACLDAFAEAGSEARHRYEVLRESGVKP